MTSFMSGSWFCFSRRPPWTSVSAPNYRSIMENIMVGAIALLLFVYLFVAIIRPEKF